MKASRSLGARLFWVVSRCAMLAYRTFPFRGHLPGAIAIIPRHNGFVAVHRNDGLGLAFPGGVCRRNEDPAETVCREIREETGLLAPSATLLFSFRDESLYPAETFVFQVEAPGTLRSSWEGEVTVATLDALNAGIIRSQRRVVEWLFSHAAT
jgi:8-oxo-dGTP pyrophosphatase MutT (NUDIX family)